MISLLIWVLVLCIVFGAIAWAIQWTPLPAPFQQIALVVVGLMFLLLLLGIVLPLPPPVWHPSLR